MQLFTKRGYSSRRRDRFLEISFLLCTSYWQTNDKSISCKIVVKMCILFKIRKQVDCFLKETYMLNIFLGFSTQLSLSSSKGIFSWDKEISGSSSLFYITHNSSQLIKTFPDWLLWKCVIRSRWIKLGAVYIWKHIYGAIFLSVLAKNWGDM